MKKTLLHLNKLQYIHIQSAKKDAELNLINKVFIVIYNLLDEYNNLPIPNFSRNNNNIKLEFFNTEKNTSILMIMYDNENYKVIFNKTDESKNVSFDVIKTFIEEHIL